MFFNSSIYKNPINNKTIIIVISTLFFIVFLSFNLCDNTADNIKN